MAKTPWGEEPRYLYPDQYPHRLDPVKQRPHCEKADAVALFACMAGEATSEQAKRAIDWVIHAACETYGMPYRDEARMTDFVLGQMGVGQQIVHFSKLASGTVDMDRLSVRATARKQAKAEEAEEQYNESK